MPHLFQRVPHHQPAASFAFHFFCMPSASFAFGFSPYHSGLRSTFFTFRLPFLLREQENKKFQRSNSALVASGAASFTFILVFSFSTYPPTGHWIPFDHCQRSELVVPLLFPTVSCLVGFYSTIWHTWQKPITKTKEIKSFFAQQPPACPAHWTIKWAPDRMNECVHVQSPQAWSNDRLNDGMNEWMHDCLNEWLIDWLNDRMNERMHDRMNRLPDCMIDNDRMNKMMIDCLHDWMNAWLNKWMIDFYWLIDWLIDWLKAQLNEGLIKCMIDCMHQWMNGRTKEQMSEEMNARMNECTNDWMGPIPGAWLLSWLVVWSSDSFATIHHQQSYSASLPMPATWQLSIWPMNSLVPQLVLE
jgi:hypothetical protein